MRKIWLYLEVEEIILVNPELQHIMVQQVKCRNNKIEQFSKRNYQKAWL